MADFSPERRRMLQAIVGLVPVAGLAAAVGCTPASPPRPDAAHELRVPLASLPMGERVHQLMGTRPVELIRGPEGVQARSLWCTHMGCEVKWTPAERTYKCRCHDGVYDEDGEPIAGPPPRKLRLLRTHVEGDVVVVQSPVAAS